jgi:hypothetical protein
MRKFCKYLTLLVIALLCAQTLLVIGHVNATSTTMALVNPIDGTNQFNFTTAQKSVGDTFAANITINNVAGLSSWQAGIAWNPTLLAFVSFVLPADNVLAYGSPVPASSASPGYLVAGASLGPGAQEFNGSGRLAVLTFRIIQGVSSNGTRQVNCNITFENLGEDTFLLNSQLVNLDFTPVNAMYTYTAPTPPPASLYVSPPKVVDPTLTAGFQFDVNLTIASATNVNTWGTDVFYDNTILNATGATEGDFLKSLNSTSFSFSIQQNYNATNGLVHMSCTLSVGGAYGNGTLATITFQVLGLGQSGINMANAFLLDPSSLSLPFNTANGYFNNILMAKLSIDPPEVTGSQYVPGTTFTINVTLEGVQDFRTAVFNLTYDPSVIQEIDINVPSVLGNVPIKKLQVDDGAGYIWCNITFHNGITTFSPVTIMTVQFEVLAMGVSPINITATQLYDINNNLITHEVNDGIFIGIIRHVAVTNVITDINIAYQGWNVYLNITVKNEGNVTETFNIHFYFDSNLGGTTTVVNLAPNEQRIMPMTWNTSAVPPNHNYTISASADPVPYQTDLSDINFTDGNVMIRWLGDVNGDGKVDMRDIAQLVLVFRTFPGKPGWDPLFDLDRNGIVDMRDIVLCIQNFGKGGP